MALRLPSDASIQFSDYAAVLRRRKFVIAASTLVGVALTFAYSYGIAQPSYVSQTELVVKPVVGNPFHLGAGGVDKAVNMGTEKAIATSSAVAQLVKNKLKLPDDAVTIASRVNAMPVGNSQLLTISYADSSKAGAQRGAQAFAEAYLEFKQQLAATARDTERSNILTPLQVIDQEVNATQALLAKAAPAPNTPQAVAADARLRDLEQQALPYQNALAALDAVDVRDTGSVVTPAVLPVQPATPRPKLYAAAGAFLGLFIGLLLAFFWDRLSGRLRDRFDLEDYLGAPLLATVPRTRLQGRQATLATMARPDSPAADAYRILRARMLVLAERRGLKTVLVASPVRENGASAVAANLAVSLAQVGKQVVLVAADLRSSQAHFHFGLDNERGLSNVLTGTLAPWEAAQQPEGIQLLSVFVPGSATAQADELLQSAVMRELLAANRLAADFVVVDAPPTLDASACLLLATLVDGVVVVADARRTNRDDLTRVQDQLGQIGAHVLGGVMSNAKVGS
jgi:capsular exopolysaccharide synthesis family protein